MTVSININRPVVFLMNGNGAVNLFERWNGFTWFAHMRQPKSSQRKMRHFHGRIWLKMKSELCFIFETVDWLLLSLYIHCRLGGFHQTGRLVNSGKSQPLHFLLLQLTSSCGGTADDGYCFLLWFRSMSTRRTERTGDDGGRGAGTMCGNYGNYKTATYARSVYYSVVLSTRITIHYLPQFSLAVAVFCSNAIVSALRLQ